MSPVLPPSLDALVAGYDWRPVSIGESGGTVHRLSRRGRPTLYLKHGSGRITQDIVDEFARLQWLQSHVAVPAIRYFAFEGDSAWLLTAAMRGKAAYAWLVANPDRRSAAVAGMARFLRALHALPPETCPFNASLLLRLAAARANIDAGRVDLDEFDPAREGWSAEQVWERIHALPAITDPAVLTHGDFSLDNIFLDDAGTVSGCIDVGRAGLADRYQDLAILSACLDEFDPTLKEGLFKAYGTAPDRDRIELHLCLDELF